MKKFNYQKGNWGEGIARQFLEKKGFCLITSNFRTKWGEIDLIMEEDKTVVFVEVKLKMGENYGLPEEMISSRKLRKIKKVAEIFLRDHPDLKEKKEGFRFDAVCIVTDERGSPKRISHYENLVAD